MRDRKQQIIQELIDLEKNEMAQTELLPAPASKGVFILNASEVESLSPKRGRAVKPSEYLEEVQVAIHNPTAWLAGELVAGDVHAIRLSETRKASWVGPQLRKAAKQLDLEPKRLRVLDRSGSINKDAPHGFVAFWVVPAHKGDGGE